MCCVFQRDKEINEREAFIERSRWSIAMVMVMKMKMMANAECLMDCCSVRDRRASMGQKVGRVGTVMVDGCLAAPTSIFQAIPWTMHAAITRYHLTQRSSSARGRFGTTAGAHGSQGCGGVLGQGLGVIAPSITLSVQGAMGHRRCSLAVNGTLLL